MFLVTESDKFELGYARFLRRVRRAIQETYEEQRNRGITQASIAAELNVDRSVVSKRLAGAGNVTLRTVSDLFLAMGREALENFKPDDEHIHEVKADFGDSIEMLLCKAAIDSLQKDQIVGNVEYKRSTMPAITTTFTSEPQVVVS